MKSLREVKAAVFEDDQSRGYKSKNKTECMNRSLRLISSGNIRRI